MTPTQLKAKALNIDLSKRTHTTLPYGVVLVAYVPKSDAELQTEIDEAEAKAKQSDARERAEYERLRKKYGNP